MNADARPLTIPARACAARRGAPRSALILRFCIKQHPHVPIKRYAWRCLFIPDLFADAAVRRGIQRKLLDVLNRPAFEAHFHTVGPRLQHKGILLDAGNAANNAADGGNTVVAFKKE